LFQPAEIARLETEIAPYIS